MSGRTYYFFLILIFPFFWISCGRPSSSLQVDFSVSVDGNPLQCDTVWYVNAAGNPFQISEVQFFISHLVLTYENGEQVAVAADDGAHYVDVDIPTTLSWHIMDELPVGKCTSVSFVFGLEPSLNQTWRYPNPPENNMSWPSFLGGGYHYMKINGRWQNAEGVVCPFNLHTGRGCDVDGNVKDYNFMVTLPTSDLCFTADHLSVLYLQMDVQNWFRSPYVFDLNEYGGSIMQNAEAQEVLQSNGWDVFTIQL